MTSTVNTTATTGNNAANIVNNAAKAAASSSSSSASSTTSSSQSGLNTDFNQFLTLLTTQLKNQDPTAPLDTNQITQQIASLSQVQQQINTNTNLNNLLTSFNASQTNSAVSYIGKQVDATGNQVQLSSGTAALVYDLPTGTTAATVTIKNSTGGTVFTGAATATVGRNQVAWPGTNSITGATAPDGTYTFSVSATDANGKAVTPITTYTTGTVTAVDTANGVNTLVLGNNLSVPVSSVTEVYNSGTNPGA